VGIEIERKFLVVGEQWRTATGSLIAQGYLNRDKARTVRVRLSGEKAYLTIKGPSVGVIRPEFEYPIPVRDAQEMLALCDGPVVQKVRHLVPFAGLTWEVDEFLGDNAGLVVAEIELTTENQVFDRPVWLGQEVSDDPRYFNSNLAVVPFSNWRDRLI
jgi:adenylate cyclase